MDGQILAGLIIEGVEEPGRLQDRRRGAVGRADRDHDPQGRPGVQEGGGRQHHREVRAASSRRSTTSGSCSRSRRPHRSAACRCRTRQGGRGIPERQSRWKSTAPPDEGRRDGRGPQPSCGARRRSIRVALFLWARHPANNEEAAAMNWDWQVFGTPATGQTHLGGCCRLGLDALGPLRAGRRAAGRLADGHPAHHAQQGWLVLLGNAWTELFRNIPLLVQIFLWYHVCRRSFRRCAACRASCWSCFGLGSSPRRASPSRSRPASRRCRAASEYAGLAMGLTLPQTYRYVLLPMAFRIVIPPLTSESMNIIRTRRWPSRSGRATMFAMQAQERPRAASRSTSR